MREMKYCSFFFFPKQQILLFKLLFLEERMDPRKQRHSKHPGVPCPTRMDTGTSVTQLPACSTQSLF